MATCEAEGCGLDVYCRVWCCRHYQQWLRARGYKGPSRTRGTPEQKFWGRVDKRGAEECWPWVGSRDAKGYGKAKIDGEHRAPHRFSYELHKGPIPEGYEIDHLCRNTSCVNPAHLEAVTPTENMARRRAAQTHCRRGHEFTPENTKPHTKTGSRVCRACMRDYQREWMREHRSRVKT